MGLQDNADGTCVGRASGGWADPDGARLIKAFVVGLGRVATRRHANELLANQHLEVVRTDLCNAYAAQTDGGSVIFVFRGLVKAIMFVLELGDLVASLDEQRHKTDPTQGLCGLQRAVPANERRGPTKGLS
jgi:hypothetical protein